MNYNFVLVHTGSGKSYAKKIARSLRWINQNKHRRDVFSVYLTGVNGIDRTLETLNPENTIIHSRAAYPDGAGWMSQLFSAQERGFIVVNSPETLALTSNKLACSLHLQGKVNHPKSWEYDRNSSTKERGDVLEEVTMELNNPEFIIAKPLTSLEQGANVRKINISDAPYWDLGGEFYYYDRIDEEILKVPGNKIVIQEYIPYIALHRVIVIGGKALPYTFIDKPGWKTDGDWKVSCCLNRTTMRLNEHPFRYLLQLAENTQRLIGGKINFIDIFEYLGEVQTNICISEINTACNLSIHENLARNAGRRDWNIHYRIAKQLIKEIS
jgi:glutathione synthase/RimK-type ligase-like ATP-grasp enzyme